MKETTRHLESVDVARAAVEMALSRTREEETSLKEELKTAGIRATAVDIGGEFTSIIRIAVERTMIAAKREGIIRDVHTDEGAVAGATREAMSQITPKALGLNAGGKIGISRRAEHLIVAVFLGVGLVHLNEVAIGLGHRAIPSD